MLYSVIYNQPSLEGSLMLKAWMLDIFLLLLSLAINWIRFVSIEQTKPASGSCFDQFQALLSHFPTFSLPIQVLRDFLRRSDQSTSDMIEWLFACDTTKFPIGKTKNLAHWLESSQTCLGSVIKRQRAQIWIQQLNLPGSRLMFFLMTQTMHQGIAETVGKH